MSDTVGYITLAGIVVVALSSLIRYCYRSKCSTIDVCCGAIHIERNTDKETPSQDTQDSPQPTINLSDIIRTPKSNAL